MRRDDDEKRERCLKGTKSNIRGGEKGYFFGIVKKIKLSGLMIAIHIQRFFFAIGYIFQITRWNH